MSKNIENQYLKLLKDILDNGVEKQDRTGTGTISVFGRQIRHDMSKGFPLLTTKKMYWKGIVTELLWFLRGDTNIKFLVDNDCHIWDGDAYKNYLYNVIRDKDIVRYLKSYSIDTKGVPTIEPYSKDEFIERIKNDNDFAKKWGELGPIYGKQWRNWGGKNITLVDVGGVSKKDLDKVIEAAKNKEDVSRYGAHIKQQNNSIDQIQNLINDLKTNPDSRRLMVNAWNVGELDNMILPPCHYGFQCYVRDGKYLSLMWNQRSVDTFLGLPFNIASYGLLLEIIAKAVNMVPDELIGNLGDVHLYKNHVEQAKEQLTREPYPLPKFNINTEWWPTESGECGEGPLDAMAVLNGFSNDNFCKCLLEEDIQLGNYQSHSPIKATLSN